MVKIILIKNCFYKMIFSTRSLAWKVPISIRTERIPLKDYTNIIDGFDSGGTGLRFRRPKDRRTSEVSLTDSPTTLLRLLILLVVNELKEVNRWLNVRRWRRKWRMQSCKPHHTFPIAFWLYYNSSSVTKWSGSPFSLKLHLFFVHLEISNLLNQI